MAGQSEHGSLWPTGCLEQVYPSVLQFLFFFGGVPDYWASLWGNRKNGGKLLLFSPTLIGNLKNGLGSFLLSSQCLQRCSGRWLLGMTLGWFLCGPGQQGRAAWWDTWKWSAALEVILMLEMPLPSSPGSCSFPPFPSARADKMEEHVPTTPMRYFQPERL